MLIPPTSALCFDLVLKPRDPLNSDATLAEPFWKSHLIPEPLPISFVGADGWHYSLPGDSQGSTEANGAQKQTSRPETAELKKYLHLYSRESPCSKKERKKNMNGEDKAIAVLRKGGKTRNHQNKEN